MVLGKLPVPGRPTILITEGQRLNALAVGAGGGCFDIFTLIYPFAPLSFSVWQTARYRLTYCRKGPLNPKQPTKNPGFRYPFWQHTFVSHSAFSKRAVVSYWRKYVHEVLVNRLGGLSLLRKSVFSLTVVALLLLCCFTSKVMSKVMSGRSINLTTLFLGRLRPPKRLTSTSHTYFRQ